MYISLLLRVNFICNTRLNESETQNMDHDRIVQCLMLVELVSVKVLIIIIPWFEGCFVMTICCVLSLSRVIQTPCHFDKISL
jgi:hypothetical protein